MVADVLAVLAGNGGLPESILHELDKVGRSYLHVPLAGGFPWSQRGITPFDFDAIESLVRDREVASAIFAGGVSHIHMFWLWIRSGRPIGRHALSLYDSTDPELIRAIRYLQTLQLLLERLGVRPMLTGELLPTIFSPEPSEHHPERDMRLGQLEVAEASIVKASKEGGSHVEQKPPQAVVMFEREVISIETRNTDVMLTEIARNRTVGSSQALTLCKLPNPYFHPALDQPTIGDRTVELCHSAGISSLVVCARTTRVINRSKMYELATKYGIDIVALNYPTSFLFPASSSSPDKSP